MRKLDFISAKRAPVDTNCLVENGVAKFGTFKSPIENINLLDCHKPCGKALADCFKKSRYTEWEAFELNLKDISIVSAVYGMGAVCFSIATLYDKTTNEVHYWQNFTPRSKIVIAQNLMDNSFSEVTTKRSHLKITNDFGNGICHADCKMSSKKHGELEYNIDATIVAPPSIVSIPLGDNKPLYTEKDLFKASGYVIYNGKRYETDSRSTAIVDDHKGFYPFKASYYWLTTMGVLNIDGKEEYIGFNLTKNQSINEHDYNENLLWVGANSYALPPVKFEIKDKTHWRVYDEYKRLELNFAIKNRFKMLVHLGIIDISYYLPFGEISGYILDDNGVKYTFDGMTGIGEDRSQRI